MILFIDDEKWAISGYFDYFEKKEKRDNRYEYKHFFYPTDAWKYIKENKENIDLIILDLMLFYGKLRHQRRTGKHGGLVFLEEFRDDPQYDNIPVLLYSIVSKLNIEPQGPKIEEIKNVAYLPRSCSDREFYHKVKELLNKKAKRR
jgi:CheY-like chemotaxis protein